MSTYHATQVLCFIVSIAVFIQITRQMPLEEAPQDFKLLDMNAIDTLLPKPLDNATVVRVNCTTSRGMSGECVVRQACDYGTPFVDRTLYATKGYIRICSIEKVCCPFDFIVNITATAVDQSSQELSFDDDE